MSCVSIYPSAQPRENCSWCGLRVARHTVHASPTCTECKEGGRKYRVQMSIDRLRRAAEGK